MRCNERRPRLFRQSGRRPRSAEQLIIATEPEQGVVAIPTSSRLAAVEPKMKSEAVKTGDRVLGRSGNVGSASRICCYNHGIRIIDADQNARAQATRGGSLAKFAACAAPPPSSIDARRYKAPCIAQSFSGRSVRTSNLGSLFCDAFEFIRRPGPYCFYFGYRTACRNSHSSGYRIRSISGLRNEHDVV
jgi:hypothetical protein